MSVSYRESPMLTPPGKQVLLRIVRLQQTFPLLQLILLVGVYVYGALTLDGFVSWNSTELILILASIAGLASAGQTFLILMGGFDLSVPGFIVAGALIVTQGKDSLHVSFVVALLMAMAAAAILGGISGQICHRFRIQPLIVTLAMGTIAVGGVIVGLSDGGDTYVPGGSAPAWLTHFTSPASDTFGIKFPPVTAVLILVIVAMTIFLYRTAPGRRLLATGANQRAAEYSLINTRAVWTAAFAFSAVASVLVGLLVLGFAGSITLTSGDPYLFQSVVAVIVGGTVFGGPGDYTRTVIGALFLTLVDVVLSGHGASPAAQQIFYGVSILVALSLYGRGRRLRDRV
jgi:ribose transport system permease protein